VAMLIHTPHVISKQNIYIYPISHDLHPKHTLAGNSLHQVDFASSFDDFA